MPLDAMLGPSLLAVTLPASLSSAMVTILNFLVVVMEKGVCKEFYFQQSISGANHTEI